MKAAITIAAFIIISCKYYFFSSTFINLDKGDHMNMMLQQNLSTPTHYFISGIEQYDMQR